MQLKVLNVTHSSGISKKTGSSFDMKQLSFMGDFESVDSQNYKRQGFGFNIIDVNISDSFFPDLASYFRDKFKGQPLLIDFKTSVNGSGHIIVTGFASI